MRRTKDRKRRRALMAEPHGGKGEMKKKARRAKMAEH
jgi:hypothetical protein